MIAKSLHKIKSIVTNGLNLFRISGFLGTTAPHDQVPNIARAIAPKHQKGVDHFAATDGPSEDRESWSLPCPTVKLSSQDGQRKCEKCAGCGTESLERMMVQRKMMEWRQLNAEFVVKLNLERQKQTKLTTSCSSSPCSEGLTKMFNGPAVRFYPPC